MRTYVQLAGLAGAPPRARTFQTTNNGSCKKSMVLAKGERKQGAEIDFCKGVNHSHFARVTTICKREQVAHDLTRPGQGPANL